MARLAGIELSRSRCALVDLDVSLRRGPGRVRAFRTIGWSPENPTALAAMLRTLRQSNAVPARAFVTVWDAGGSCRHVSLPSADDASLRSLALREAGVGRLSADLQSTSAVLTDRIADWRSKGVRDATVVTAAASLLRARLAPLVDAGFTIEAAITPPVALASLARLLRTIEDDAADAYVAVNAEATAIAVVRHGVLLFGREIALPFGGARPQSAAEARTLAGEAVEYARRLAPELKRSFLAVKQESRDEVARVFLCGELPHLRSLTAPLMQALHVDVATLDAPQGLAGAAGGALDADIRDRAGELRVAWATAADPGRSIDLQPRPTPAARQPAAWRSTAATIAAGLVLLVAAVLASRSLVSRGSGDEVRALRSEVATLESKLNAVERASGRQPAPVRATSPAAPSAAPAHPATVAPASPPAPAPAGRHGGKRASAPAAAEPAIQCILYGPGRRLALIDQRIVRVGDVVAGGVIADIEPRAVILRRPSGELRRIEVKWPGATTLPAAPPRSDAP